ncbi:alkaline phosphatase D family protein [Chelatococcus sp. SYSU_G07232]|uniref:Alkaline phosphatase D family protein n=1 Tax=Chelatococcus albus TaxID=3047466 RepID=A0ABT7AGZ2_9HYPH|nr:alkaline phosphatase D family protein [Chelatococcus sp. SYSU_G07232]MDJ1158639.1 alkaline phosphatase D family protein [Chelatococcus sp. SYSU_G07232]
MRRFDVDQFVTIGRRRFLKGLASSALLFSSGAITSSVWANPAFFAYPFRLGVASGDPAHDSVVLWTRLAPDPFNGGGMPMKGVEVGWEIAGDEKMRNVLQKGKALARPELGHAVHVEVGGLEPAREYFYRFTVGDERSPVGRTKTLPAPGAPVAEIRFAAAGCQRYEDGYFTAYRHMARERLDFVFHYGDYIYEYRHFVPGERDIARTMPVALDKPYTLTDYRNRYAVYKADLDLQAAHASAPFIVTFDDHNVENNFAGDMDENGTPPEIFLLRRAAAFQAYYEHMPLRRSALPRGADILAHRRFALGGLADLHVLDTRQYRSDQACGDSVKPVCKEVFDTSRTMLGEAQERWLADGLAASKATWNVLAQQVIMMRNDRDPRPEAQAFHMDKWDGYVAARGRLLKTLDDTRAANPIVLTGDIHNNWAGELKADFDDMKSKTLGIEFVATSISSGGDGFDIDATYTALLEQNPQAKFFNNQRGYLRHVVTPRRWQADYQVLETVRTPGQPIRTRKSLVVEAGMPRIVDA